MTVHGSQAYGTSSPTSDLDVKGIAIPPKEYFLGFNKKFEQAEIKGDPDVVVYDIRKFVSLAAACNPNIIEVLFTDPSDWLLTSNVFDVLHKHRNEFLSAKAVHTFTGYAVAQLKRIRTHKEWLLHPPSHKPTREEFGLSIEHAAVNATDMGAFDKLIAEGHSFDTNVMAILRKEKEYSNALLHWNQFQEWKKSRNEKRAELEAKFGYDTKHAGHLVRLMRMAREILLEGKVLVKRPDAEELKAIRAGSMTYDELMTFAQEQDKEIRALKSILPPEPNYEKIDELTVELVEMTLGKEGLVQYTYPRKL